MEDFLRYIQGEGFHEKHKTSHKSEFDKVAGEITCFVAEFFPGTPAQDDLLIFLSMKRKAVRAAICSPANQDRVMLQKLSFRHVALNEAIKRAQNI